MAKTQAPRPDHLFVGPHTFEIRWLTEDEWNHGRYDETAAGLTDHHEHYIAMRMGAGCRESNYQTFLLHEVQHAVWATIGLNHLHTSFTDDEREENVILLTSPMLLFVMQQNPTLIAYLQSDGTVVR